MTVRSGMFLYGKHDHMRFKCLACSFHTVYVHGNGLVPTSKKENRPIRCRERVVSGLCLVRIVAFVGTAKDPHVSFHRFPSDKDRRKEWLSIFKLGEEDVKP